MDKRDLKSNLRVARTCVYNCNYHIVFSTRSCRKVFNSEIEDRLKQIVFEIARDKGFEVFQIKVDGQDRVHVFASAHPKVAPSYIVKMIKGITARKLLLKFPVLKKEFHRGHLWNSSYYIETIGSISEEAIEKYIESQKKK